jgi:hypothetical protein
MLRDHSEGVSPGRASRNATTLSPIVVPASEWPPAAMTTYCSRAKQPIHIRRRDLGQRREPCPAWSPPQYSQRRRRERGDREQKRDHFA